MELFTAEDAEVLYTYIRILCDSCGELLLEREMHFFCSEEI
jgi:hypothetical protein